MVSKSKLPDLLTTTLIVANIHCPSCVSYATDVLSTFSNLVHDVNISIIDHTVRIQHEKDISAALSKRLLQAAFEVEHVSVKDQAGQIVRDFDVQPPKALLPDSFFDNLFMSKAQNKHINNCNACQDQRKQRSTLRKNWPYLFKALRSKNHSASIDLETNTAGSESFRGGTRTTSWQDQKSQDGTGEERTVELSIEGMTCASCVATITDALHEYDYITNVNVNLVKNAAKVTFLGSETKAVDIQNIIDDTGYTATVSEVFRAKQEGPHDDIWRAFLSIEGMTCSSCVGTITRGLRQFGFVHNVSVELVSNSARVSYTGEKNIDTIVEEIDEMGYNASLLNAERTVSEPRDQESTDRLIQVQLAGMYCSNCPTNITAAIYREFADQVTVSSKPTLKVPRMTLNYTPSPPQVTVRRIIETINSVDQACSASIYHPPSLEQRSRTIQRKERNRILRHLLLTFLIAIPTFIIGVVYMSLVPGTDATREWLEEPIWKGNVLRSEWALFIMTTPVMFYGANIFHTRAFKEVWTLWRPGSRIPILRRFYRFGSMNLLISAGTSVAYFASLAVLIMEATSSRNDRDMEPKSSTYFDTVTFLTLFILLGRFLEAYSKAKTGDAVSMLADLRPSSALLLESIASLSVPEDESRVKQIPVDLLEIGDIVRVPHGACPPTDGVVVDEGFFLFDESSLTGESRPAKKTAGDKVFTGTTNVGDPINLKVVELGGKSMLDQIVDVVREGQARRAPIERLADMLTGYFTPVITLLAICTWIIWLVLGESGSLPSGWLDTSTGGWPYWSVEFAIAVFVVACPCGIGLAAPTALFVGGGLAAKSGILVQGGGEAFQEASRLDAVVFDKTGTLTEGRMKVTHMEMMKSHLTIETAVALAIARSLEESSTHPIANAIVQHCADKADDAKSFILKSSNVQEIPGHGMLGQFEIQFEAERQVYEALIGNERLLNEAALKTRLSSYDDKSLSVTPSTTVSNVFLTSTLSRFQSSGSSTAILAIRSVSSKAPERYSPVAVFAITDPIRNEAPEVLASLRLRGLDIYMCTGDHAQTAQSIASQLGIPPSNVRAGVLPQGKAAYIHELQTSAPTRKVVAFVGDGTNDTPALTAADVSIALSHPEGGGSDIALTSSSFVLLNSDLTSILTLVKLSKRVFLRVKLNFLWAAIYNICLIPVAAGVFFAVGATWGEDAHGGFRLNPVWASVAMACSSISVVLSSLALRLPEIELTGWMR